MQYIKLFSIYEISLARRYTDYIFDQLFLCRSIPKVAKESFIDGKKLKCKRIVRCVSLLHLSFPRETPRLIQNALDQCPTSMKSDFKVGNGRTSVVLNTIDSSAMIDDDGQ